MQRKRAAFSGSWYPGDTSECRETIKRFLNEAKELQGCFSGGIVPHAGWYFSGSIACRVIAAVARNPHLFNAGNGKDDAGGAGGKSEKQTAPDVVFVFGMHMHPTSPACIMVNGSWETPLGDLRIHDALAEKVADLANIQKCTPNRFPEENTIELQLPFIKYLFPEAAIVPIGVPPTKQAESIGGAAVSSAKALGINIVVIGSTDMTHYGSNYAFSPKGAGEKALDWVKNENDRAAIEAMIAMDGNEVLKQGAEKRNLCCAGAVAAALFAAKKMGAVKGVELDYASSYDKSPGESFVGYAGILFSH